MKKISLLILATIFALNLEAQRRPGREGRQTAIPLEGTVFHIRNVAAQRYIDLPGKDYAESARKNAANVQLWDLDEGGDRKVTFIPAGNGYYHIRFQHANVQLDVGGCSSNRIFCRSFKRDKGANIQIWSSGSSHYQQWKLEQINPGQFRIINRYSGMSLDASGPNIHRNGCNVLQWEWHGGKNQLWELVCVQTGNRYQE